MAQTIAIDLLIDNILLRKSKIAEKNLIKADKFEAKAFARLEKQIDKFLSKIEDGKKATLKVGGQKFTVEAGEALPTLTYLGTAIPEVDSLNDYVASLVGDDGVPVNPELGQSFALTTGLDNVQGTAANDTIDARTVNGQTTLDQFDVVNGGEGRDTLIANGFVDLRGVSSVEILNTTADVALGAPAVAAGIDTVILAGAGQLVGLTDFAGEITVNGNASSEQVFVDLTVAGDKTLNLGAGNDLVGVEVTGQETAADAGSIEVRFESAKVGDGANSNVSIIGSASTVTVNDEGTLIVAGTDPETASQANLFKVQGINADGSVAAGQDRGNFSYVVLGTEADNEIDTQEFGNFDQNQGNVYINAGMGDDTLSATAAAGQRHFLVGGAGDDVIQTLTTESFNQDVADGTVVVLAGSGDDQVTVGGQRQTGSTLDIVTGLSTPTFETTASTGIETIDLGTGNDTLTVLGGLNVNKAGGSSFAGGEGTDTLVASINALKQVEAPVEGQAYTVSGFEAVTLAPRSAVGGPSQQEEARDLVLANIQEGLATVNAATDISNTNIVFDVSSATINLAAGFGNDHGHSGGRVLAEIAGEGTNDTLTINNSLRALVNEGEIVAQNAFSRTNIEVDGIENIVLNGTGLPLNATSTVVPAATTQTVNAIFDTDFEDEGSLIDTVTLTGSNSFELDFVAASTVDASGLTAEAGLFMDTLGDVRSTSAVTQTITGSANKDEIFVSGNEPGEGFVSVAVNINLGAGDDQVELSAFASTQKLAASTIVGGAGRDTLAINTSYSAGAVTGVSGFEVLSVNTFDGRYTQDMLQFVNNTTFDTIRVADVESDVTLNNVSNSVTTLEIFGDFEEASGDVSFYEVDGDIAINRLVDNSSNAITIVTRAATAESGFDTDFEADIFLDDEETITIDTGARVLKAGVSPTPTNLMNPENFNTSSIDFEELFSAEDLTTLVLKGDGDIDFEDLSLGETARVVSIDASAMTGDLRIDADDSETNASLNLVGSSGENDIEGTDNNDVITIVSNADSNDIEGNGGNDTISFTGNGFDNEIDGGDGNDVITVTANRNAMNVNDQIQVDIEGGSGNDIITVTGTASVEISGGSGADTIVAGSGNDIIRGGLDADLLTGGAGEDKFVFAAGDSTARNGLFDTVTDFNVDDDSIEVYGVNVVNKFNDSATNEAALLDFLAQQDGEMIGQNAAILFTVGNDGYLFIDANGDGMFNVTSPSAESEVGEDDGTFDVLVKLVGVTDINDISFVGGSEAKML